MMHDECVAVGFYTVSIADIVVVLLLCVEFCIVVNIMSEWLVESHYLNAIWAMVDIPKWLWR